MNNNYTYGLGGKNHKNRECKMKKVCDVATVATALLVWMSAVYVLGLLVIGN